MIEYLLYGAIALIVVFMLIDVFGWQSMSIICLLGFHKKSSVIVRMRLGTVITEQHCHRCGKKFIKVNGV